MSKKKLLIALVALSGLAVSLAWTWPRDAAYYYNRGEERLMATDEDGGGADPDGALADFNRAIKLNPQFAAAYRARGSLKEGDSALKDFSRAIELEPTNKPNYLSRVYFWENHSNLSAAMADLDQAIAANPNDEALFTRRAQLKHRLGDFSGMVADLARVGELYSPDPLDLNRLRAIRAIGSNSEQVLHRLLAMYDRAIEQDPGFAWGYYHRGALKLLANDLDGAFKDFQQCSAFSDSRLNDYAAIQTWMVRTRRGETNAAAGELLGHFSSGLNQPQSRWALQIARFLANQINEQEFFATIEKNDAERELSEFWYYSAMKHLLAGDKAEAVEYFHKARTTQTRPYVVAISSQIELGRLGQ